MVLPVTARGALASAVGIRKAGRWTWEGDEFRRFLNAPVVSSGRVTAGIACGNKLKRDGWRVVFPLVFLLLGGGLRIGLIIQFRSFSGRRRFNSFSFQVSCTYPLAIKKGYC